MRSLLAFAVVLGLSGAAVAGEETSSVQVTIKGMTCPDGCGASVTKGLQSVDGVKEVKLTDFEKGLFTLSVDAAKPVKPSAIKAKIGKFEITKVEATLSGTVVAGEKDALTFVAASGAKYSLTSCGDCPVEAAKSDERLGQLRAWAKAVKVSGTLGECCEGALSLAVAKVELAAPKN